jgi:hypothetical protein
MKLKEAIRKADSLRPNTIDEEQKVKWIAELEGEIAETERTDIPNDGWAEEDPVLLMPYPKDEIYVLYLMAKIDYANEEMQLYADDSAMANERITEAKAWWVRNNPPRKAKKINWW